MGEARPSARTKIKIPVIIFIAPSFQKKGRRGASVRRNLHMSRMSHLPVLGEPPFFVYPPVDPLPPPMGHVARAVREDLESAAVSRRGSGVFPLVMSDVSMGEFPVYPAIALSQLVASVGSGIGLEEESNNHTNLSECGFMKKYNYLYYLPFAESSPSVKKCQTR
jgi:hypothetical protein